ncbi:hypothetical protein PRZ48_009641 [Zasmidium cellare]|uniref:Uncharacterized protein n=1 Tax=Zasmidium cellare TaxID=395010 RepID=A0ABR0EC92_ZASCE|nr:hypothetical protein PRZ48_009641 [Zasmidium cellare]
MYTPLNPGDISLSGDLFEGNFEEWQPRTIACLRSRDLERQVGPNAERCRIVTPADSKNAAHHIRLRTSEAMLRRVPDAHLEDAGKLFKSLKRLATPFRLFDLPPEIRNRVYEFTLGLWYRVHDNSAGGEDNYFSDEFDEDDEFKPWAGKYPPLLQVNSQIRHEASSIFYAATSFMIALPSNGTYGDIDREYIEKWSKDVVGSRLKHLHHVVLTISIEASITIKFSERRGVMCTFDWGTGDISEQGDDMLEEHTQAVESARKALGLSGEAIVMAILSGWGMWRKLREEIVDAAEMDSDDGWD